MDTPDFDQIARRLAQALPFEDSSTEAEVETIHRYLVEVWNARGAADIAKLETVVGTLAVGALAHALRTLDR